MAHSAKGVPEAASAIIPRLFCRDIEAEIEFCRKRSVRSICEQDPGRTVDRAHAC